MALAANDDAWLEGEVMQWEQQERLGMQKLRERRLAKIAATAAAAGVMRTSAIRPAWARGTLGRKIPPAAPWSPFGRNASVAATAQAARPGKPEPAPAPAAAITTIDDEPDYQDEWADVRSSFDLTLAEYKKSLRTRSPKLGERPNPLKYFLPRLAADVDAAAAEAEGLTAAAGAGGATTGPWDMPSHPGSEDCEDCREAEQRATVAYLLGQRGYEASRRVTEWAYSRGIPSGEYEFVQVTFPGAVPTAAPSKPQQLQPQQTQSSKPNSQQQKSQEPPVQKPQQQQIIVDITFRAQFTLFRPTPGYQSLWSTIPRVFVGTPAMLRKLLTLLIEAMRVCVSSQGLHLPPWRRSQYMNSKWLAPSRRRPGAAPSPNPPALCPMHQREAEAGDAWCGACSGTKSGGEAVSTGGESGSGRRRLPAAAGAAATDDGTSSCGSVSISGSSSAGSTFGCSCRSCSSEQASMMLKVNAVAKLAANLFPAKGELANENSGPAALKLGQSDQRSNEANPNLGGAAAAVSAGTSEVKSAVVVVATTVPSPYSIPVVDAALLSDLATAITRRLPSSASIRKHQQQQGQQYSVPVAARQLQGFELGRGVGNRSSSNSSSVAAENLKASSERRTSNNGAPFWELLLPAGPNGDAELNAALFMRGGLPAHQIPSSVVSEANYRSPSNSAFQAGGDGSSTRSAFTSGAVPIAANRSRARKAGLLSLQLRASSVPDFREGSVLQVAA